MTSRPESLAGLSFSLVGPGRVGSSLAHWLVALDAEVQVVAGRSSVAAARLAKDLSARADSVDRLDSSGSDLLVIAVSDAALESVALRLAARRQARVVLHTSGRATAQVLNSLRAAGSAVGSLHPLKAFPEVLRNIEEAHGTVFGIDGDPAARELARRLAGSWSGVVAEIPADSRPLYHLAATLAAGGVVTLLAIAAELAERVGLPPQVAGGYLELARGAVRQAAASADISSAITGPVARGDLEGFEAQVEQLRPLDAELAALVEMLAQRTLHHCSRVQPELIAEARDPELPHS